MKIGVVLGEQPPELGGAYTIQLDIFESFLDLVHESKHDFVVFANFRHVEYLDIIKSAGAHPIHYPSPTLVERFVMMLKREFPIARKRLKRATRLERLAMAAKVDFVWFISEGPVMMDLPYLTVVWDLQHRTMPWFPEVSSQGIWDMREDSLAWFLRRASRIIVGTEAGRQDILRCYQISADRFKVLPHPTPGFVLSAATESADQLLAKYSLPEGYLFYPAQFWPHKNHASLLKALQVLREEFDLVLPVVFVGSDRGNRPYIEGLISQLELDDQVHLLGFVPDDELIALYQSALALIYTSFGGPENLPPLEAFALGCPVVAADIPGAEEQLGDTALLVDPGDPGRIAAAIHKLYHDPELRDSLVAKGLQRAAQWTGADYVRGVFEIFDEFESVRFAWGK